MIAASLLVLLALYLNRDDYKMLMLTFVVGISYFLPVQYITDPYLWYVACISAELSVFLFAFYIQARASSTIMLLCTMLTLGHINGWLFHGYLLTSPYHFVIPYLEYLELIACSLFSTQSINILKESFRWILRL